MTVFSLARSRSQEVFVCLEFHSDASYNGGRNLAGVVIIVRPYVVMASVIRRGGQNVNVAGTRVFFQVLRRNKAWLLPHLRVQHVGEVDWRALANAGFKGCIFDKDNTITAPYAMQAAPGGVEEGLARCMEAFEGQVAVLSNSAGLKQFDPDGKEAEAIERALGIPVLRHAKKKPDGDRQELEEYFNCKVEQLVMVGDRLLTDMVYGNRLGMLTIMPEPITTRGEPVTVKWSRALERRLDRRYCRKGIKPLAHPLVPDASMLGSFKLQSVGK